ncbi:MAG: Ig-like domain-containing protein, partial [Oscillospiraceae bacterium]|nr:Ig-like domain-containing protein [Oscillospiraceae bacterium]
MRKRLISILLVFVMLMGILPTAGLAAEVCLHPEARDEIRYNGNKTHTVKEVCADCGEPTSQAEAFTIDFIADAKRMAQLDAWDKMKVSRFYDPQKGAYVEVPDARYVGSDANAAQLAAAEEVHAWIEANCDWRFADISAISKDSKRLTINSGDDLSFGLRIWTIYINTGNNGSQTTLYIEAPADGIYDLELSTVLEDGTVNYDGGNAGGVIDIYINGAPILQDHSFNGKNEIEDLTIKGVALKKGENALMFCTMKDKNGHSSGYGDAAIPLRYMAFTPASAYTEDCTDRNKDLLCDVCGGELPEEEQDEAVYPAGMIVVDFKDAAQKMAQEPFWEDLRSAKNIATSAIVKDIKGIGRHNSIGDMTAGEKAAYDDMLRWLDEHAVWNIDEVRSDLKSNVNSKRVWFNIGDEDWGLRLATGGLNTSDAASRVYLTVQAEEDGIYELDISLYRESKALNYDGYNGGGIVDVYVNDALVMDDYATLGGNETVVLSLGGVELKEGENTVEFHCIADMKGNSAVGVADSERAVSLRGMVFVKQGAGQNAELPTEAETLQPAEAFEVNFKETVSMMKSQSWWEDLQKAKNMGAGTYVETIAGIGNYGSLNKMTKDEVLAYDSMLAWLAEHANWNINEGKTDLKSAAKRLLLNAGGGDWGIRVHTANMNTDDAASSLYLTMDAPAEGTYDLFLYVFRQTKEPNLDHGNSGGYASIYVGDTCVLENYYFMGENELVEIPVKGVALADGENELRVELISDWKGTANDSERAVCLHSLHFTPVDTVLKTRVGTARRIDLRGSYLDKGAVLTKAEASNDSVHADVDEEGNLLLSANEIGSACVTVTDQNGAQTEIAVAVEHFTDPQKGSITLTEGQTRRVTPVGVSPVAMIHQISVADPDVARASISGGKLKVEALKAGFTAVTVSRSGDIAYTLYVKVEPYTEPVPSAELADFAADAAALSEMSLWETLDTLEGSAAKLADERVSSWLGEFSNWDARAGIALDAEKGIVPSGDSLRLIFHAPAAGDYRVSLQTYGTAQGSLQIDSDKVLEGSALNGLVDLGELFLMEGNNTLRLTLTDAEDFALSYLQIVPVSEAPAVQVLQGMRQLVTLQGTYLPENTEIGQDTCKTASSDEAVATAAFDKNGVLKIYGHGAGTAEITVKDGKKTCCFVNVEVIGRDAIPAPEVVHMDFVETVRAMAQEPWWNELKATALGTAKVIGTHPTDWLGSMDETERDAYRAMLAWLDENRSWNFDEGASCLENTDLCKSVTLNAGANAPYGLLFYSGKYLNEGERSSLYLTVEAAATGTYAMELSAYHSIGTYVNVNNVCAGGIADIYVNSEKIREGYRFAADPSGVVTVNLGMVELDEGENTLRIDILSDRFGGTNNSDRAPALRSVTFTPVQAETVQDYTKKTIDLNASYLPFDEKISAATHEAVSSDESILCAAIDKNGQLELEGMSVGEAKVQIRKNGRTLCTIEAVVTPYSGDIDGLGGNAVRADLAAMSVSIPADGMYAVQVQGSGDDVGIYVDDTAVCEGLQFAGVQGLGAIHLSRGTHIVRIEGDADITGVIFAPLGTWKAEIGRALYLTLTENYLPFDADVSGLSVFSDDKTVADAAFDADGDLVVTGKRAGIAHLTVSGPDVQIHMTVRVIEPTDLKDVTYTLDGFEAATLQVGMGAIGDVRGKTLSGTAVAEKRLREEGAVYFVSSDPCVATVDQRSGDITCVGEGSAVITAYVLLDGVTKSAQAKLSVTDDTDLASISVTAQVPYLGVSNTMQLHAEGLKASGVKADMDLYPVAWSVDDASVATVTESGALTAHRAGTVTVTATVGVMRRPVTADLAIEIVETEQLPAEDIYLDFSNDRVTSLKTATLEKDGLELDREKTYNGGESFGYNNANGMYVKLPEGESFVLNFHVKRSGWYRMEVVGTSQLAGGQNLFFVDDAHYMGFMDFAAGQVGLPWATEQFMNTVWLDAGVHAIRMQASTGGTNELGWYLLHAVDAPGEVDIALSVESPILVGQAVKLNMALTDENGNAAQLLQQGKTPHFTNYYKLTTSDPAVLAVSGSTLTAKAAGEAVITLTGEVYGSPVTKELSVTVQEGNILSAELTAEQTTFKPQADAVQLTFTAYGANGSPVDVQSVSYLSDDPQLATVDEHGLVTLTGKTGSVLITAVTMDGSREVEAKLWLTVTQGKTEPTLYTMQERAIAQENVLKYDWAWQQKEDAVRLADLYVENVELLYDMWIREGLPRNCQVGFENDPNYRNCRYCGVDLVGIYSHYPWIVDPIENPWKITCPVCKRDFPSNDFESYYKSGLDERGYFHAELADPQYLVNELYPEMGEGWGVDDGWGYKGEDGTHTYISYYLQVLFRSMSSKHGMNDVLTALAEAYMFTGEEKYGVAGAILTDRMADIYPEYDLGQYSIADYAHSDGGNGCGRIMGAIWEADHVGPVLSQAVDAFWPAMDDPEVIEFLRAHADFKGVDPEAITPEYVRENAVNGILLELKRALEERDCYGNPGMQQEVAATVAVVLDREPETSQLIDWLYTTSVVTGDVNNFHNSGGDVNKLLVEDVDRDGFGYEVSYLYNSLWPLNLINAAEALSGYGKLEGVSLWDNQKYVNMFSAMARLSVCGRLMAQTGEAGAVQSTQFSVVPADMITAFVRTGNEELARCIYFANGNSTDGLHADIFTRDPERGLRGSIKKIVDETGEFDVSDSNMMSGFGIAILREGPARYMEGVNDHLFSDYWMYFGRSGGTGHEKYDALAIDFEGFGIGLSSTMGYPMRVIGGDPEREQWVRNTTSHNTVVVNDKGQSKTYGGFPMHFEDAGRVKVMDAENAAAYPETDIYRRTLVTVAAENGVHYAVDFFRILGGSEHVYSFHAAGSTDPVTEGLDLIEQPMGTYAGADVPYGAYYEDGVDGARESRGGGYSWLYDVSRDDSPETTFSLDWKIEDFHHRLATTAGIRLRLTMLSEEPMTEVAIADAAPPQNGTNPDHLEYALVRRSGDENMDTLFTAVIEPYQITRLIESAELVPVELIAGTQNATDRAAAIKTTLTGGRVDYVIYATNASCTYRVDDTFDFRGFTGVVSYEDGAVIYAWGSETERLSNVIEDAQQRVTGRVVSFTEGIEDNYYLTVEMDAPVSEAQLEGRYIYVDNDGERNAAYRIYGAQVDGSTAVLDLYSQTLVRAYVDNLDLEKGYKHNISVGDSYSIPLSAVFDINTLFVHTTDLVVKVGNKQTLTLGKAGIGAAYEVEGLPTTAKVDARTGTVTWTPSRTQTGRYPVTVKAVCDGETVAEMSFVIYVVSYTGSAYEASKCNHSKAVTYTVGGVTETVCPACGTISKETAPAGLFKFVGSNMTLGNELKLNFMVNTSDLKDGYTALITHKGETVEASFNRYNSTYSFVSQSVAAKEMADAIEVVVVDADGKEVSEVYTASVRDYAMKALTAATSTAKVKTMVVDMLNYGAAAQTYFKYNEADLANKLLTNAQKAWATPEVACTDERVKGENYYGSNLSLEDKILLNLYFKNCTESMTAKVTYTDYSGKAVTAEAELVQYSGNIYKVVVDEIVLADAFCDVTVTV